MAGQPGGEVPPNGAREAFPQYAVGPMQAMPTMQSMNDMAAMHGKSIHESTQASTESPWSWKLCSKGERYRRAQNVEEQKWLCCTERGERG